MQTTPLKNKKIFFMGTPDFAAKILDNLAKKAVPIKLVITQPDKAAGRKKNLTAPGVKITAKELGIPIKQFAKLDEDAVEFFKREEPDLVVVVAYGLLLPKSVLQIPKYGCINLHPSKLPRYRGPSPMQTAILDGRKNTALTIMLMDEKMDHGDILFQQDIAIDQDDTIEVLEGRMIDSANENFIPVLDQWINGKIKRQQQQHEKATFTKIIKKADGKINWNESAQQIFNQFRAFHRWPKVYSILDGNKITFHEMEIGAKDGAKAKNPGEVFLSPGDELTIAASTGFILPKTIQFEGKKAMDVNDFINGNKKIIGSVLS